MLEKIILLPLLFSLPFLIPIGFHEIQADSHEEAQKEACSYIDTITKETQSNKETIVVDWDTVGNAPREVKVEFEKDMLEKNYKVQNSHDGIVVYKKVNKVT